MDELVFIAIDPEGQRSEWVLSLEHYVVGRDDGRREEGRIAVGGDPHLSRQHFELRKLGSSLVVKRCEGARNPLFYRGEQQDEFELEAGGVFFSGKTQFGSILRAPAATVQFTLARQAKERARLRRLEDCFGAVLHLLEALRGEAGGGAPWRVAFPVVREILPDVERQAFVQVHRGAATFDVLDKEGEPDIDIKLLQKALEQHSTVTFVWEDTAGPTDQTLCARSSWAVASPVTGLEGTAFVLCAFGESYLARETLEEVAAIVDVVAELVGHHLVVEAAAQYSSLLGVFGHHVGTLFKTSGALKLWSGGQAPPEMKRVLENLLPIWGISQAISLHKKRGEQEWQDLLRNWIDPDWAERSDLGEVIVERLRGLVGHAWAGGEEPPFLEWTIDGQPPADAPFQGLPPLRDNPVLFDKTLALTVGLIEMLSNLRKYPEARGAGREDRRELSELESGERAVIIHCENRPGQASVVIDQPVVTTGDGQIPRSRSLDRIRSLEDTLVRGLVETHPVELLGPTSLSHIVRIRHRWTFHWGRLVAEWRTCLGQKAQAHAGG